MHFGIYQNNFKIASIWNIKMLSNSKQTTHTPLLYALRGQRKKGKGKGKYYLIMVYQEPLWKWLNTCQHEPIKKSGKWSIIC